MEEIDLKSTEDLTLFTDEEHVVLNKIDFKFEQVSKIRGLSREITLFNGNHCYQSIKNKHKRKYKYRVDIAYLNPHPFREHHIAWKWLYLAGCLALISLVIAYAGWFTELFKSIPDLYLLTGLILSVSAAFISLLLFVHNSYDKVIFKTRFSNIKLIELLNKNPNKDKFRQFVGRFIIQIKKAHVKKTYDTSKFLAMELRELRRLRDEQVIKDKEYQRAKSIIFKHDSFKAG